MTHNLVHHLLSPGPLLSMSLFCQLLCVCVCVWSLVRLYYFLQTTSFPGPQPDVGLHRQVMVENVKDEFHQRKSKTSQILNVCLNLSRCRKNEELNKIMTAEIFDDQF